MMGVLYKLDFASGKSYIGITVRSLKYRFGQHKTSSQKGTQAVYKAWRKYGQPTVLVLAIVENTDLAETEVRAIRAFGTKAPNGYNMADGGIGAIGVEVSQETREKLRKKSTGRKKTAESIAKTRAGCIGRKRSAEFCEKMSQLAKGKPAWNKGVPTSAEALEKSRRSHLGYKHREESLAKMSAASKVREITPEMRKKMWAIRKANKRAQAEAYI